MKKSLLIIALCMVLCLCACAEKDKKDNPTGGYTVEKPHFTAETLPRLDGSTATIPLSEGLVSDLLGYDAAKAQEFVHHNTTHNAYVNLIEGKCDIIFVTPPSDEELKMLEEADGDYKVVRVVKDAFVFLVNSQNKLDNLSLNDIKAIYKGEKKNWSELSGESLDIIPYQRPDNSGSQTLMYKLVLGTDEIMPAPIELKPGEMGELVDAVSSYSAGKGAIGYSVYYYASGMYVKDGSKLIAVDGVFPTPETIANDSYPLVEGYYAVYKDTGDKESPVEKLLEYILSDDGQKIAEASGYVPLR